MLSLLRYEASTGAADETPEVFAIDLGDARGHRNVAGCGTKDRGHVVGFKPVECLPAQLAIAWKPAAKREQLGVLGV